MNLPSSLLTYIEAPLPMIEGDIIIKRLIDILSVIENIATDEDIHEGTFLNRWKAACQSFLTQSQYQKPLNSSESLRGIYEDHQPYVSLFHQPADITLKVQHNILLAQLFIANASCRKIEDTGDHFDSSRKTAFTFARSICKRKYSSVLEQLPATACSVESYLSQIESINDIARVASFSVFIRYALGLRKGISRDTSGNNHRRYPAKDPVVVKEDSDLDQPSVTHRNIGLPLHSPSKEKAIEKSGLSVQEFSHNMEFRETSFCDERPMDGRSSSEHILRSKSSQKHIAMNNQHLPCRWSALSELEASCVAAEILNIYRKAGFYRDAYIVIDHEEVEYSNYFFEISALLTIMFWFSVPYKDAIKSVVHKGMPKHPTQNVEISLGKDTNILIKTVRPTYKTSYKKYKCLKIASYLPLNSGLNIEQIIWEHSRNIDSKQSLFPRSSHFYYSELNLFLDTLNHKYDCKITLARLSTFIFDAIANQQGSDITYAMLITGRTSYIGINPLYYTAVSHDTLLNIFQKTCKSIAKNARLEMGHSKRNLSTEPKVITQKLMYGARIRPEHIEVKNLCVSLTKSIQTAKSSGIIATHNAMTIYTSAFINFATGYRAVGDASFCLNEIDFETGFAVISDKDSIDEHHSRLIWMMEECIEQIKIYRAHLHFVLEFAALKLPKIYKALSHELLSMKQESTSSIPGLFIIKDNKIVALSPSIYESYFPDSYPYPANAHRHFLRSNLLEMECPSDVLNAFMGHWEIGQEPWSDYSTLGAMDYRDTISPLLTKLLTSSGWKAINPHE